MTENQQPSLRQRVEEASVGIVVGIVVVVVGGIVLAFILGRNSVSNGGGGSTRESEPLVRTPPPALQARDKAVPDAKGPVRERVWALDGARTFKNPYNVSGEGSRVPQNAVVMVACKVYWPELRSVKQDGYWYRLLTAPWKGLYSPANSYWNDDKPGEPANSSVDWSVKECGTSPSAAE
jgi:hypothetical protein